MNNIIVTIFLYHLVDICSSLQLAGTARTSLVVTIGPSARHYSETSSTIMFGQRVSSIHHSIGPMLHCLPFQYSCVFCNTGILVVSLFISVEIPCS